ncbi:DUF3817 domain-containing protein [Jatrophihabitans fulvus]
MSSTPTAGPANILGIRQPRVAPKTVDEASGALMRYRVMAFVTGVVLLAGTIELIVKYAADVDPPLYALLWIGHGWLFMIYVIITALLGFRLRWPLLRYAVVMLAGTIPTMSFVAEHFVTRQTRRAADGAAQGQPADVRD